MGRFESVDALQNMLARDVFSETASAKKAAGRALGTLVELITFYMIRDWELEGGLAIERGLPEYGNKSINHNVEFTLHPASNSIQVPIADRDKSLTLRQIMVGLKEAGSTISLETNRPKTLRTAKGLLRHAALCGEEPGAFWTAHMVGGADAFLLTRLAEKPYAMFECKRVGIEEGMSKGPQTIEKAKQGAYVARTVSGLQRVPLRDGRVAAAVEDASGTLVTHDNYYDFLRSAIDRGDLTQLANVVLTVGVVSNHGNWFTAETQNKEMRVLAQSYDWLLFLTDAGLAEFVQDVLHGTQESLAPVREAFKASFGRTGGGTSFTKVTIDERADAALTHYFATEQPWDRWFNVIAPAPSAVEHVAKTDVEAVDTVGEAGAALPSVSLDELRADLHRLRRLHEQEGI